MVKAPSGPLADGRIALVPIHTLVQRVPAATARLIVSFSSCGDLDMLKDFRLCSPSCTGQTPRHDRGLKGPELVENVAYSLIARSMFLLCSSIWAWSPSSMLVSWMVSGTLKPACCGLAAEAECT